MRVRGPAALAAVAAGVAALAAAGPAAGASRTLTLDGWSARTLAFSGDRLAWTDAATVRVDPARVPEAPAGAAPFRYYRADVSLARLAAGSRRFAGAVETPVSVRTSIAAMDPGLLVPGGRGDVLAVPGSRRFAPPVIHCCDDEGIETVVESDGRADAPVTVAATLAGSRVRTLRLAPDGGATLREVDLATGASSVTAVPVATAPGLAALAPTARSPLGLAALAPTARSWVDPAAPAALMLWDEGAPGPRPVALPGRAVRVWSAAGLTVVAVRRGARVLLVRIEHVPAAGARRIWSGRRVPPVALGGRSVAIADGRRVLGSRRGPLRPVVASRRRVDAVGVSGRRLAWVERARRGGARVGVVRLGRMP